MMESPTKSAFFSSKSALFFLQKVLFLLFFFGKLLYEDCTCECLETSWHRLVGVGVVWHGVLLSQSVETKRSWCLSLGVLDKHSWKGSIPNPNSLFHVVAEIRFPFLRISQWEPYKFSIIDSLNCGWWRNNFERRFHSNLQTWPKSSKSVQGRIFWKLFKE